MKRLWFTPLLALWVLQAAGCQAAMMYTVYKVKGGTKYKKQTPQKEFHDSARMGHLAFMKTLLKKNKIDVNAYSRFRGETPLYAAARKGHLKVVLWLLQKGAAVNLKSHARCHGDTPLHGAIRHGHKDIFTALLQRAADVTIRNSDGWTPLFTAINFDRTAMARVLIEKKGALNVASNMGWTPIHLAAAMGESELVTRLMAQGVSPDQSSKGSALTPLFLAVATGQEQMVTLLLKKKCKVAGKTAWGETPLHRALLRKSPTMVLALLRAEQEQRNEVATEGLPAMVKRCLDEKPDDCLKRLGRHDESVVLPKIEKPLMVQPGARAKGWAEYATYKDGNWEKLIDYVVKDPSLVNDVDAQGDSLLAYFVMNQDMVKAQRIIRMGVNMDHANKFRKTALYRASGSESVPMVALLLKAGAKIDIPNRPSPLLGALGYRQGDGTAIVKLLLKYKANPNVVDNNGKSPLHKASGYVQCPGAVKPLLEAGVKINLQDKKGKTALHYASKFKRLKTMALLIKWKANLNITDKEGRTPLHLAAIALSYETIKLLVEAGAKKDIKDKSGRTPFDHLMQSPAWEDLRSRKLLQIE